MRPRYENRRVRADDDEAGVCGFIIVTPSRTWPLFGAMTGVLALNYLLNGAKQASYNIHPCDQMSWAMNIEAVWPNSENWGEKQS